MCEKSVFLKSECANIAINIVGTPLKQVIFSSLTQAKLDFGEKYGINKIESDIEGTSVELTLPQQPYPTKTVKIQKAMNP